VSFIVRARWVGDVFAVLIGLSGAAFVSAMPDPVDVCGETPDASEDPDTTHDGDGSMTSVAADGDRRVPLCLRAESRVDSAAATAGFDEHGVALACRNDRALGCSPSQWLLPEVAICMVEERLVGAGGVDRLELRYDRDLHAVVWVAGSGSRDVLVRARRPIDARE
jgi:hypothetical protein